MPLFIPCVVILSPYMERESQIASLLRELAGLRGQLDEAEIARREQFDSRLDQSYAELVELAEALESGGSPDELHERTVRSLRNLAHALRLARQAIDGDRSVPSSLEGSLRELQERVMKLVAVR